MMKARTTNNVLSKRSTKSGRKDQKLQKTNSQKRLLEEEKQKESKEESNNLSTVASDSTTQSDPSEVYETVDVRYLDDDDNGATGSCKDAVEEQECKDAREGINGDVYEDASNGALSGEGENEAADVHGGNIEESSSKEKIEYLETKIEKLEEELREVAALEISLYSVVPDHCSSVHKLHTPARRISRIYIYACKHFSQGKRAMIARNSVSGLVLVARSCGNDVSRLTFWLSNIITLREIISQAFGKSQITQTSDGNENGDSGKKTKLKWKNGFQQLLEDWQETETFTTTLEKIEFWIFSRIVESVWWQVFTPQMQSNGKSNGLADHKQGMFSISLWKNAFQDALNRLCPMRGAGHECGCLPILARMVIRLFSLFSVQDKR